jgi:hypothetical protein
MCLQEGDEATGYWPLARSMNSRRKLLSSRAIRQQPVANRTFRQDGMATGYWPQARLKKIKSCLLEVLASRQQPVASGLLP